MEVSVSGDFYWEARLDQVIHTLSGPEYQQYFDERDYGDGLNRIGVMLVCQEPEFNLKRRIRLTKKDKILTMDIMLGLPEMKVADAQLRRHIVAERLLKEVPEVVSKYEIDNFDSTRFIDDFKSWVGKTGWVPDGPDGY
jgi:hypothetical protein